MGLKLKYDFKKPEAHNEVSCGISIGVRIFMKRILVRILLING